MNKKHIIPIIFLTIFLLLWLEQTLGIKWALMAFIGFLLGFTLSFSGFGIVFGWRQMLTKCDSFYVRSCLITISIEIVLFTICLSFGHAFFGGKMVGNIIPIGIPFIGGAFLFGCGMQLAGVCASGTLYCCGEAKPRFWIVLIFYGIGTLIGHYYQQIINTTFHSQVVLMKDLTGGFLSGALLNLAFVGLLFVVFSRTEFKRTKQVQPLLRGKHLFWRDGHFT
ncbi:YeeE/YedE thiosulfate transporter family protein, partial [Photobacterium carnosum]